MNVRDIDPHEFRSDLSNITGAGYSFDEVVEETNRLSDLQELVVNSVDSRRQRSQKHQPPRACETLTTTHQ